MKRSVENAGKHRRLFLFGAKACVMMILWQIAIGMLWPDLMVLRNGLALMSSGLWCIILVLVLSDQHRGKP